MPNDITNNSHSARFLSQVKPILMLGNAVIFAIPSAIMPFNYVLSPDRRDIQVTPLEGGIVVISALAAASTSAICNGTLAQESLDNFLALPSDSRLKKVADAILRSLLYVSGLFVVIPFDVFLFKFMDIILNKNASDLAFTDRLAGGLLFFGSLVLFDSAAAIVYANGTHRVLEQVSEAFKIICCQRNFSLTAQNATCEQFEQIISRLEPHQLESRARYALRKAWTLHDLNILLQRQVLVGSNFQQLAHEYENLVDPEKYHFLTSLVDINRKKRVQELLAWLVASGVGFTIAVLGTTAALPTTLYSMQTLLKALHVVDDRLVVMAAALSLVNRFTLFFISAQRAIDRYFVSVTDLSLTFITLRKFILAALIASISSVAYLSTCWLGMTQHGQLVKELLPKPIANLFKPQFTISWCMMGAIAAFLVNSAPVNDNFTPGASALRQQRHEFKQRLLSESGFFARRGDESQPLLEGDRSREQVAEPQNAASLNAPQVS